MNLFFILKFFFFMKVVKKGVNLSCKRNNYVRKKKFVLVGFECVWEFVKMFVFCIMWNIYG